MGLSAIVVVGALVWLAAGRDAEPRCNGRSLSQWLLLIEDPDCDAKTFQQALVAVREIGTNGIPWLVRWIGYKEPPLAVRFEVLRRKLQWFPDVYQLRKKTSLQNAALQGFRLLGRKTSLALSPLERLLESNESSVRVPLIADAMQAAGSNAFPNLLRAMEQTRNAYLGIAIVDLYGSTGCDVSAAVPTMLLMDRTTTAYEITNVGDYFHCVPTLLDYPDFLIPALGRCAGHTNPTVRSEALKYLRIMATGSLGPDFTMTRVSPEVWQTITNATVK